MNRIVLMDPVASAVGRIIALQYNPASILRAWQIQGVGGESGERSESLRLKRPPMETIKVKVKIDAINQRSFSATSVTTEPTRLINNRGLVLNLVEGIALPRLSTGCIQLTGNNPTQSASKSYNRCIEELGHE